MYFHIFFARCIVPDDKDEYWQILTCLWWCAWQKTECKTRGFSNYSGRVSSVAGRFLGLVVDTPQEHGAQAVARGRGWHRSLVWLGLTIQADRQSVSRAYTWVMEHSCQHTGWSMSYNCYETVKSIIGSSISFQFWSWTAAVATTSNLNFSLFRQLWPYIQADFDNLP